jgi:DNA-binding transcriptional regulator YhcF (GntR family)
MNFKHGTWFKVRDGIANACNNGRKTIAVNDLAKKCGVSQNTIYKLWKLVAQQNGSALVYNNGAFYDVHTHDNEGIKSFTIFAKGI